MEKENKYTLPKPFNYFLLFFGLELIIILSIFLSNGYNIFKEDPMKMGILLPLGFLTFISIFFGIEYNRPLSNFSILVRIINEKFKRELETIKKNISTGDLQDKALQDFKERYNNLKELERYTNPLLWAYLSVFLCIFAILINFTNFLVIVPIINVNIASYHLISLFIHLGILSGLFLITSYMVLISASHHIKKNNPREEEALRIIRAKMIKAMKVVNDAANMGVQSESKFNELREIIDEFINTKMEYEIDIDTEMLEKFNQAMGSLRQAISELYTNLINKKLHESLHGLDSFRFIDKVNEADALIYKKLRLK